MKSKSPAATATQIQRQGPEALPEGAEARRSVEGFLDFWGSVLTGSTLGGG
jgi:hypothetical protein